MVNQKMTAGGPSDVPRARAGQLPSTLIAMRYSPIRRFLDWTSIVAGSILLASLPPAGRGSDSIRAADEPGRVTFTDIARKAGLNAPNVWGAVKSKKYIVEAKGSGVAFFDYDNDGWRDIYLT